MARHYEENTNVNFLIGTLVGGAIGTAATLLLAPKAGEDLRQDIVDRYEDLKDSISETHLWGQEPESNNTLLWGSLAGGAIAAAAALMLAPKKKASLKRSLMNRFEQLSEIAPEQVKEIFSGLRSNHHRRPRRRVLARRK